MTEHPLRLVRENNQTVKSEKAKHNLGGLDSAKYAKRLVLFRADPSMLDHLLGLARPHIPGMADSEVVRKVLMHNPDCVWVVSRKQGFNPTAPVGEGFIAMLPLTAKGLHRLAIKAFNGADPELSLDCLAR